MKMISVNSILKSIEKLSVNNRVDLLNKLYEKYRIENVKAYCCSKCNKFGSEVNGDSVDTFIECKECGESFCEKCSKEKMEKMPCYNCMNPMCKKCFETKATECENCDKFACSKCRENSFSKSETQCIYCIDGDREEEEDE